MPLLDPWYDQSGESYVYIDVSSWIVNNSDRFSTFQIPIIQSPIFQSLTPGICEFANPKKKLPVFLQTFPSPKPLTMR